MSNDFEKEAQSILVSVAEAVAAEGGRAYKVGGCVRDQIRGLPCKDFDVEVFGLPEERLSRVLKTHFRVNWVGKHFGVFKLKGYPIDISLPRREKKVGFGHRGFATEVDSSMSLEAAAQRRDFTLNAIYEDVLTGEIHDPVGGAEDLEEGRLKHVSSAFSEDSLRVLRAMQFIARFDLNADEATVALCRCIDGSDLPMERVGEEFFKLLTQGKKIGNGLRFIQKTGWLKYFPELEALVGCKQDPLWHPEGDVWTHTLHCLDAFSQERTGDAREDWIVGLSVLTHDLGKPETTVFEEGRWRSPKHEYIGVPIAERFLSRLTGEKAIIDAVLPLVECHMRPFQLFSSGARDPAVRRLAGKVGRIDRLIRVCRADKLGRPPIVPEAFPELEALEARAKILQVSDSRPEPILHGRDLINLGMEPSKDFGEILHAAFDAQLEGIFTDLEGGRTWLKTYVADLSNNSFGDLPQKRY